MEQAAGSSEWQLQRLRRHSSEGPPAHAKFPAGASSHGHGARPEGTSRTLPDRVVTDSFVSRESTARNHTWTLQISKIQIRHDLYTCILLNTTEYTQFAMCHCLLRLYIQSCLTRRNIIHMLTQIIHRLRFSSVCSTAKGYKQINKQGRVQN
jgi:hypothetical protein